MKSGNSPKEKILPAVALCAVGAEKALSNELRKLGLKVTETAYGKAKFQADTAGLYRALMGLRTADRVLLEMAYYHAGDFDELFEGAQKTPWEQVIPAELGLSVVKVRTNRSKLRAETSIQSVIHKAIAGRLCEKYQLNKLPSGEFTAEVRVYIEKDMVSLLLDLSGEPLFKRGYRTEGGAAPLRETTAAAMLLLSGWKRKFPLYDPFCGSGTILIEAAMYAWDMAPCLERHFAMEKFLIADPQIERAVREELRLRINFNRLIRIAGSDGDNRTVSIAQSNIQRARDLAEGRTAIPGIRPAAQQNSSAESLPLVTVQTLDNAHFPDEWPTPETEAAENAPAGFLLTNPPYGRRLGDSSAAERIYGEMNMLGRRFPGWKLAVISDHSGFESFYGSKATVCKELSNGAVEAYFFQYEKI